MSQLPTIVPGSRGQAVTVLQFLLKDISAYFGPIEETYGQELLEAVTHFKRFNNLSSDGIIDGKTWDLILNKCSKIKQ